MSTNGYVIPVDPAELSNRFASVDKLLEIFENGGEEEDAESDEVEVDLDKLSHDERVARMTPLLDRIPIREADLIYLYYIEKKKQADIAEMFGVTQAAISYRLDRGLQRIKFLLSIPPVDIETMRQDLARVFKPIDVDILVGMWQTTCQSEVAAKLGLTQGRVRHRFFKSVEVLAQRCKEDESLQAYSSIFSKIADKHFNILRAVQLPQWSDRGGDICI